MGLRDQFALKNPSPTEDKLGTGLRLTDVIFGFVFKEVFFRLADWNEIPNDIAWTVRIHLVLVAVLVLGSYIGYRNSLKRADYEIAFVNLPMVKFVLDQGMVVLYFVLATRTPDDPADFAESPSTYGAAWMQDTITLVLAVTCLYLVWDFVSFLMTKFNYGSVKFRWLGLFITLASTLAIFLTLLVFSWIDPGDSGARAFLIVVGAVLILYRVAKDHRVKPPGSPVPTEADA